MFFIDTNKPDHTGKKSNEFTDGDPTAPTPIEATPVSAEWLENSVQKEIFNVLHESIPPLEPKKSQTNQMSQAIEQRITRAANGILASLSWRMQELAKASRVIDNPNYKWEPMPSSLKSCIEENKPAEEYHDDK